MWQPPSPTESTAQQPMRDRSASMKMKNPGRRFGQVVRLRPECVAEYKECHARVWPEVLKQIKDCGLEDCTQGQIPISYSPSRATDVCRAR